MEGVRRAVTMGGRTMRRCAAVILLAALAGPAAAQTTMSEAAPRIVAPEKLEGYWAMLRASLEADVPNFARNVDVPGCATVSFVVEPTGATSTVRVQKVVPEGDLARVAASLARNLRFEPTAFNAARERVFSWLIFPFNLPPDRAAASAIMQRCHLTGLDWSDR